MIAVIELLLILLREYSQLVRRNVLMWSGTNQAQNFEK